MNDTILQSLILNVLTQQQYQNSEKSANELYLINDLDYSEILVVNYGTSAYNNITQALESNKLCILKKDEGYGFLLTKKEDGTYIFFTESDGQFTNITIDSNNTWTEEEIDLSQYMTKNNPTGTGSFSMNRKADTIEGDCSTTFGNGTTASGAYSCAEGWNTIASAVASHAEGFMTEAIGQMSHAEGTMSKSSGLNSHAEGYGTKAEGDHSHAEGHYSSTSTEGSHAEGYSTETTSDINIVPEEVTEEEYTELNSESYKGKYSHVEGYKSVVSGAIAHAEGLATLASGLNSHAEGYVAIASGDASHAEGGYTTASGLYSHAEGSSTTASGNYSHAEGDGTTALLSQHAQGHYNNTTTATAGVMTGTSSGTAFVIGNGTSSSAANAFRITYNGKPYALSSMNTSGADYAEFFEWQDLNPNNEDRRGYFVTLDGEKIKIAEPNDYILGIISALPAVIGNGDEDWRGRYILDDFGAFITEEFEYEEEVFDKEAGEKTTITKIGTKYKENPDYDSTLSYIQREDRPEWDAVGMMGVLAVRDDGTCKVNGYCKVANGGIATASENGYRVIKRINENIIKVIFK